MINVCNKKKKIKFSSKQLNFTSPVLWTEEQLETKVRRKKGIKIRAEIDKNQKINNIERSKN